MPNPKIFCNSPWYELHVYWDGSLGFCCQESHKVYADDQASRYNVKNMTIKQWMDSEPMRQARLAMFGDKKNSFCSRCYVEESHGPISRRYRSNQKSVIFMRGNFADSYTQSPGFDKFESARNNQGAYDGMPVDLHIDLGNHCNLTCKMCRPLASSSIAAQHARWGIEEAKQYIGTDWTRDQAVWDRILDELAGISNLKNVHFMGGETLITKRFEDFVDFMLQRGRTDLNFSFVTNGTVFNDTLMDKLSRFNRIGIEVSIESMTQHNAYQRQGTDTAAVLANIDRYLKYCDNQRITVTIRPALSVFTIGSFVTLLDYCLEKNLIVKSLICVRPAYYNPVILPQAVKDLYLGRYKDFMTRHSLDQENTDNDFNESDPSQIRNIIKNQVVQCMDILETPAPPDAEQLYKEMVFWCGRWDQVHGLDARKLYPEFEELLTEHGYQII